MCTFRSRVGRLRAAGDRLPPNIWLMVSVNRLVVLLPNLYAACTLWGVFEWGNRVGLGCDAGWGRSMRLNEGDTVCILAWYDTVSHKAGMQALPVYYRSGTACTP
jgi:hypothetical protein